MKKRVIILILAAVMLLAIPAQATSRATTFMPSLTFEGATAKCGIVILGGTHDQIEVTLSLWHGNQLIDTWSEEGTGYLRMAETATVTKGNTYTMKVDLSINGEELDILPISKKCELSKSNDTFSSEEGTSKL